MRNGRPRERGSIVASIAASALVLAAYVAVLTRLPLDVFWHPDEGAKYIAMLTVRWGDEGLAYSLPYPGHRLDPARRFYPAGQKIYPEERPDGTMRFRWPILFPLLARPGFEAFGIAGIYLLPLLGGWLAATLAGLWTYPFLPRGAPWAILLAGAATPVAFYSLSFFEHSLATACGAMAVTLLVLWPGRLFPLMLAVPLLVVGAVLRAELISFAAAALAAWGATALARRRWEPRGLLRQRRTSWLIWLAAAVLLVALAWLLAGLLPVRHARVLLSIPRQLANAWSKREFLIDSLVALFLGQPPFSSYAAMRAWQVAALLALGGLGVAPFADTRRTEAALALPSLLVLLQLSLLTAMYTVPFLQWQGILSVAPFTGIALFVLPEALRRRDARLLALASTGALSVAFAFAMLFMTRIAEHHGSSLLGLDGAVRYVLPIYPAGAALAVLALALYRQSDAAPRARSLFSAVVLCLMLVSLYYEFLGVRELYRKRVVLTQWREEMCRQEPVVTDVWWLPAVLAPYWSEHELYLASRGEELEAWVDLASRSGVGRFTFASTQEIDAARLTGSGPALLQDQVTVRDLNVARFRLADSPPQGGQEGPGPSALLVPGGGD